MTIETNTEDGMGLTVNHDGTVTLTFSLPERQRINEWHGEEQEGDPPSRVVESTLRVKGQDVWDAVEVSWPSVANYAELRDRAPAGSYPQPAIGVGAFDYAAQRYMVAAMTIADVDRVIAALQEAKEGAVAEFRLAQDAAAEAAAGTESGAEPVPGADPA